MLDSWLLAPVIAVVAPCIAVIAVLLFAAFLVHRTGKASDLRYVSDMIRAFRGLPPSDSDPPGR